ncbi:MAG: hypothetical protein ACTSU2_09850 [Promethearchaeota archaeon]
MFEPNFADLCPHGQIRDLCPICNAEHRTFFHDPLVKPIHLEDLDLQIKPPNFRLHKEDFVNKPLKHTKLPIEQLEDAQLIKNRFDKLHLKDPVLDIIKDTIRPAKLKRHDKI